jgi:hypothetical protein
MEQSLAGETKGPTVSHGIPRTVWNLGSSEHGSSQQIVTCPYPDTNKSTSHPSVLLSLRSCLILFSYLCLVLPVLAELYQNTLF